MEFIVKFVLSNIVLFVMLMYIAFFVEKTNLSDDESKKTYGVIAQDLTLLVYLNKGTLPTLRVASIGLIFGVIFGFMDNFGLWVGIDAMQRYIPGGIKTKAAWGNTYSDVLGASVGTFIAGIAMTLTGFTDEEYAGLPIYINTMGIFIGCLMGMGMGKAITGRS
jgi:hypothetical protein